MADVKISGLPASTTPLAGTEVLPIVQSTATKQVSVANLTAGRAVSAASLALTGSPLPVGSGGTGTATTFTTGSVVFAGASGLYSQNNASFFWDNTNKRLGLGTASPASFVDIFSADQGYAGLSLQGFAGATKWYVNAGISTVNINPFSISTNANGTSPAVCVYASGGVSIGNTTDAGAGNLNIATGNLVIGTSGKGIDFSATAGTGTSELLNDYEEGTFTLALLADSGSITLNASTMLYTKVGRLVTCTGYITVTSVSSPAGTLYFTGLPFTSNSASPTGITGFTVSGAGWGANAATQMYGYIDNNGTAGVIGGLTVSTGAQVPFASYINSSTFLRISMTYMTS